MNVSGRHLSGLIFALLLWGVTFPVLKLALADNHPITITFYRFLFAWLILLPLLFKSGKSKIRRFAENKKLFLLGVLNFGGIILQMIGVRLTTASKSAIITQMLILVVPIFAYLIIGERLNRNKIMAIIFSLFGALVLSTRLDFSSLLTRKTFLGDLFILGSVLFWAVFIVYTRKLAPSFSSFELLFPSVTMTLLLSIPLVIGTNRLVISGSGLGWTVFLAVFSTIIPTLLYNFALQKIGAVTSTIIGPVELVSALLISVVFLKESLTFIELIGTLFILGAIYFVLWKKKKNSDSGLETGQPDGNGSPAIRG